MASRHCAQTGEVAGGVLIVCIHQRYGPCLVCFRNAGRRHGPFYECPFGMYDGPPIHNNIYQTASDELWEESCGLIDCNADVLLSIGHWCTQSPWKGVCALRVDGLSRDQFFTNRQAIQHIRRDILEDFPEGSGLGCSLEMDHMSFVKLDVLESAITEGCDQYGVIEMKDVDNRRIRMRLLFDQLRDGGLALVKEALESDRVRHHCSTRWKLNPTRELQGHGRGSFQGTREISGVSSLCIELRNNTIPENNPNIHSNIRKRADDNENDGDGNGSSGTGERGASLNNNTVSWSSPQKRDCNDDNKRYQSNRSISQHGWLATLVFLVAIITHYWCPRNTEPTNRRLVIEKRISQLVEFGLSSRFELTTLEGGVLVAALHRAYLHSSDQWELVVCPFLFSDTADIDICLYYFANADLTHDLDRLSKFLRHLRTSFPLSAPRKTSTRVSIIGAGPGGLIAGVAASQAGCSQIDIFEKRKQYDRDIYFDLSDNEFGYSMATLSTLGIHTQKVGLITERTGVVTLKCAELEHFLAKVLSIVGVRFHFDFTFAALCQSRAMFVNSSTNLNLTCDHPVLDDPTMFMVFDFDVLIGSDGAHSKLRREVNASFDTRTHFEFNGGFIEFTDQNPLIGHTLIASYKVINGSCPPVKKQHIKNPFKVASSIAGVSSAFKRFFFEHCEVQVATDPWVLENSNDFPWELLRHVSNEILVKPASSIEDLQKQLHSQQLLRIPIKRINQPVFQLPEEKHVIFVGDSQVSALYRLGTGVNFQLSNLPNLRQVLQFSSNKQQKIREKQWTRFKDEINRKMDALMSSQLSALFFESVCGLIVFQDEIWRADTTNTTNVEFSGPLSGEEALSLCNKSASPSWTYVPSRNIRII